MRIFSTHLQRTSSRLGALLYLLWIGIGPHSAWSSVPATHPATSAASALSWEEVEAGMDAFLSWSEDPFSGLDLEIPEAPMLLHSGSLRAGAGYSDNPLKRFRPAGQDFFLLEGEGFLNALLPHSTLTVLFFGEWTRYGNRGPADEESLAFGFGEWSFPMSSGTGGVRGTVFYGDQIYDASLSIQAPPLGATFRQFRPEAGLFLKRTISQRDQIEVALSLRNAFFDDPQNDYLRFQWDGEWTREWSPRWSTTSRFAAFHEWHRFTVARQPNGIGLNPAKGLRVSGAEWAQSLTATFFSEALHTSLETGATLEIDRYGAYEDRYQTWAALQLKGSWKRLALEAAARWQETRYDQRQVGFLNPRTLLLQYRSAEFRATLDLWRGFSLVGKAEWLASTSRITTDSYTERRGHLLLQWSY